MKVLARFRIAATTPEQFPAAEAPEIAFLGRSNVGKSSVINSLLGAKIARTSSTPGRTRTINFYEVRWPGRPRPDLMFVDLPGYGYAKLPRELTAEWPKFIEPYLTERPTLALAIALVDSNVPPQSSDAQLLEWLRVQGRPFLVVATKSDRLSGNALRAAMDTIREQHRVHSIVPFSARTGSGRDQLWAEIRAYIQQPEENVS
jgi:GTP-binding protein